MWKKLEGNYQYIKEPQEGNILSINAVSLYVEDRDLKARYFTIDLKDEKTAKDCLDSLKQAKIPAFKGASYPNVKVKIDPNYMGKLLWRLAKFDPSFKQMLPQLCKQFKIPLNLQQLMNLNTADAIELAQYAQNQDQFELIWKLLNFYWQKPGEKNNNNYLVLYDLANSISEANPHYKEAQDICAAITAILKPEDLELRLRHALNGSKQNLTDDLFLLSTGKSIENIKCDTDTLLNLVAIIKGQNEEIAELKKANKKESSLGFFAPSGM